MILKTFFSVELLLTTEASVLNFWLGFLSTRNNQCVRLTFDSFLTLSRRRATL